MPVGAEVVVENVRVVLQVTVQLGEEKAAVTPDGSEDVENIAATALPETKVAVIPLDACWPRTTEGVGAEADRDSTVGAGAAVVKVKSDDMPSWPVEFLDAARK